MSDDPFRTAMLHAIAYVRANRDDPSCTGDEREAYDSDVAILLNCFHGAGGTIEETDAAGTP